MANMHKSNLKMSMSGISMDNSELKFVDQSIIDTCVDFIKCHNSGEMIENMYAPNKKNMEKKTKGDKIYDTIRTKINRIVIAELKKKQKQKFEKQRK